MKEASTYEHPGKAFVRRYGEVYEFREVLHYIEFLRTESGIEQQIPVELSKIYRRFCLPIPQRAALVNQQGLVVNDELGIILINENDIRTRQRFTEAHELMELLFSVLPSQQGLITPVSRFKHHSKERMCDAGAAELLIPTEAFLLQLNVISYREASRLASYFDVSRSAILVRMAKIGPGRHAVVLWRMKNTPTELKNGLSTCQGTLFGDLQPSLPPQKLRVEWSFCSPTVGYIPNHKSVSGSSSIFKAWESGEFTQGTERLHLGQETGVFRCENQPFETDSGRLVLSLLHCPGDQGCS